LVTSLIARIFGLVVGDARNQDDELNKKMNDEEKFTQLFL
jgi:hypothetical protein